MELFCEPTGDLDAIVMDALILTHLIGKKKSESISGIDTNTNL